LISHVTVPPLEPERAWALDPSVSVGALVDTMRVLCNDALTPPGRSEIVDLDRKLET
jgi:hypothetical protein